MLEVLPLWLFIIILCLVILNLLVIITIAVFGGAESEVVQNYFHDKIDFDGFYVRFSLKKRNVIALITFLILFIFLIVFFYCLI